MSKCSYPRQACGDRGYALLLVLMVLALIAIVVVTFLTSMRNQQILSATSVDFVKLNTLTRLAQNIAINQVQSAIADSAGANHSWASQPGMIRLFDAAGNPAGYRKLYTWDDMVGASAFDPFLSHNQVPSNWSQNPSVFTDLNAPVNTRNGMVYPIVDPGSLDQDPAEESTSSPEAVNQFTTRGTVPVGSLNPLPMPVKWLYVLQDGTVHLPSPASSGDRAVISAATSSNPIVGRIAFWTDDETTKINLNTASATSSQSFWDTPRFLSNDDLLLARRQPALREFQRYPGHPATVSLNRDLFRNLNLQDVLQASPRYAWGGSEDATRDIDAVASAVEIDRRRLYASVGEYMFTPARDTQDVSAAQVRNSSFFTTVHSRAPELNLFGLPRIAVWPISANQSDGFQTTSDRLIARASTVRNWAFYFDRNDPQSTTADVSRARNRQLLDFLDRLTQRDIPGFGSSFAAKYPTDERRQILTEIFDYIRLVNLHDGSLTPDRRFVREFGEHNLLGQALPTFRDDWNTIGSGSFCRVVGAAVQFVGVGRGNSTVPPAGAVPVPAIQRGTRHPLIVNNIPPEDTTAVQSVFLLDFSNFAHAIIQTHPIVWVEIEGLDTFEINGEPMGFPAVDRTRSRNVFGGQAGGTAGTNGRMPPNLLTAGKRLDPSNAGSAAQIARRYPFYSRIVPIKNTGSPATMDFSGGRVVVRVYGALPANSPSPLPVGDLVQTLEITFPPATIPVPNLATHRVFGYSSDTSSDDPTPAPFKDRWRDLDATASQYASSFMESNDVVRAMVFGPGDFRLLMKPPGQVVSDFIPHPDYFNIEAYHAHDLCLFNGIPFTGASERGSLVSAAPYASSPPNDNRFPMVPPHVDGVLSFDWDNGISNRADGAYINKSDEGSLGRLGTGSGNTSIDPNSYFILNIPILPNSVFFSPNRQMPSPGMIGSLPTGVRQNLPWRTLLLRPHSSHPSAPQPRTGPPFVRVPDHLLLDLFWMPVVEPYAMSDPFSTAGKINLNQQIVPFTYLNRMTGLRAALSGIKIAQAPRQAAENYKRRDLAEAASATNSGVSRRSLNLSEINGTLRQVSERFSNGDIFRSATEICDIYFVPEGESWQSNNEAESRWYGEHFALVGDNTRERPYANMYQLLTTKSNTYSVHYHVQVLQIPRIQVSNFPTIFDPSSGGKIVSEERGTTIFERYLDPLDPWFVGNDPASANATSLESLYRIRILGNKVFNP